MRGCNLPLRTDPDHSPSGNAAVIDYLTMTGLEARERLAPLSDLDKDEKKARTASTKPETPKPEQVRGARADDKTTPPAGAPGTPAPNDASGAKAEVAKSVAAAPAQQLVVLPDADLDADDWKAITKWLARSDHTLLIAGARALPDWLPIEPWTKALRTGSSDRARQDVGRVGRGRRRRRRRR